MKAPYEGPMQGVVTPAGVLAFWRALSPDKWFTRDVEVDAAILHRYLATHENAVAGKLSNWEQTAEGALALVLVLDQFPRNMLPRRRALTPPIRSPAQRLGARLHGGSTTPLQTRSGAFSISPSCIRMTSRIRNAYVTPSASAASQQGSR